MGLIKRSGKVRAPEGAVLSFISAGHKSMSSIALWLAGFPGLSGVSGFGRGVMIFC
ncbi:MAG: hypothetical protein R6U46_03425 [Marinilabilia sp.]